MAIPNKWHRCRLADVADINPDSLGPDWPYEHMQYVDISSVGEGMLKESPHRLSLSEAPSRARRLVKAGDTVLSTVRPNRRSMFFVRETIPDLVVSTGFAVIRPRQEVIEPLYLYAIVFDRRFTAYLVSRQRGAAYPAVLPSDIAEAEILLPPLPEQRAIARILGTLDDKIELNRRMNETLEAMAQALFKSWFVDFDPVVVNALRAGNPIPEKFAARAAHYRDNPNALGLPEDILRLFPARFVDSELDPIPEGWEVKALPDIVDIVLGGTPKTSIAEYWGGEVLWASAKDISNTSDIFITKTERTITRFGLEKSNAKLLPAGTTVITSRGTVGKLCILGVDMAINQTNYGLVSHLDVDKYFVYLAMNNLISTLKQHSHGTIFETITTETLSGVKIVYPRKEVMDIFSSIVSYFMDNIYCNILESQTLAALRDALLPKLISGELRVKDVEKILEDAV